jgi:proteasome activator subunit 4
MTDVPVGGAVASSNAMSLTLSDTRVSKKIIEAKKPIDRVQSLAEAIVYSMSNDAPPAPTESAAATPGNLTPKPQGIKRLQNGVKRSHSGDSLAAAGNKGDEDKKYLGGSKALDHLSRLLTSCETVSFLMKAWLIAVLPPE